MGDGGDGGGLGGDAGLGMGEADAMGVLGLGPGDVGPGALGIGGASDMGGLGIGGGGSGGTGMGLGPAGINSTALGQGILGMLGLAESDVSPADATQGLSAADAMGIASALGIATSPNLIGPSESRFTAFNRPFSRTNFSLEPGRGVMSLISAVPSPLSLPAMIANNVDIAIGRGLAAIGIAPEGTNSLTGAIGQMLGIDTSMDVGSMESGFMADAVDFLGGYALEGSQGNQGMALGPGQGIGLGTMGGASPSMGGVSALGTGSPGVSGVSGGFGEAGLSGPGIGEPGIGEAGLGGLDIIRDLFNPEGNPHTFQELLTAMQMAGNNPQSAILLYLLQALAGGGGTR